VWHYDVLRGLDYLRSAGVKPDERVAEGVELVEKRRHQNGRWPLMASTSHRAGPSTKPEWEGQPLEYAAALRVLTGLGRFAEMMARALAAKPGRRRHMGRTCKPARQVLARALDRFCKWRVPADVAFAGIGERGLPATMPSPSNTGR
jgi:hypothetical protein